MKSLHINLKKVGYLTAGLLALAVVAMPATPSSAAQPNVALLAVLPDPGGGGGDTANTDEVKAGLDSVGGSESGNGPGALLNIIRSIVNILLFLVGTIAVIMVIVGGIRYVTSNGDQAQITNAKNTILYSIVGVVVASMSYALVNFVIDNL